MVYIYLHIKNFLGKVMFDRNESIDELPTVSNHGRENTMNGGDISS